MMLAQGRTFQHCADEMQLSINTIGGYVKKIYAKLDVHAKEELLDVIDKQMETILQEQR
ncbi:MAG: LuxR C-terminal-related transcriptional regulator [Eggerthellaceae bacterium]|nr:LuxR C-terminal-related transcriptional regulator [Eggerthellaceae bacterium]